MGSPTLAWIEHGLPGQARAERLALARRLGLALELADGDNLDAAAWKRLGLPIATLQAWRMREWNPLRADPQARREGTAHLRRVLHHAAVLGARHVVAVCGYGRCEVDFPFERCVEFFAELAGAARDAGTRILIEPLGPSRLDVLHNPAEVSRLLGALADPQAFGVVLDTGHLLDGRRDPAAVLGSWPGPVAELQLRGPGSTPPADDLPLEDWLAALPEPPAVVCGEHHGTVDAASLDRTLARLRPA